MHRSARTVVPLLLIVVALAGCMSPAEPDGNNTSEDDLTDVPPAQYDCQTAWNFTQQFNAYSPSNPVTMRKTWCWENANHTNASEETFYYDFYRQRRRSAFTQGEWELTVVDADDDLFFHEEYGPGFSRSCDVSEGKTGTPGNWTVDLQVRNFTGFLRLKIWIDHPPEDWSCEL